MTKARTMVRGAFLSGAGMIASMAGSLVSAVIFGRMLPESQVGVFWMLILLCDGLLILSNFGLQNALPKIIADAPEVGRGGMGAGILLVQGAISLALGIVLFAAWLLLPDPRVITSNTSWLDLYPHLWVLPLLCIAATQRDTALAILAGMNRYSGRTVGLIVGSAVQVTLVAVVVAWLKMGLVALMLCTLVSYVAAAAWLTRQVGHFRFRGDIWPSYSRAVRFSIPLYINNVLGFAFQRADTVLVAMLLGSPTLVAYFEMGKRLPNLFSRILTAMLVPYLPGLSSRIAEGDYHGSRRLMNTAFQLVTFLGYSIVLAVMVIQRPLIVVLFSERYLPCLSVLWLLMTGACLALQTGILGLSLVATGHPASVTRANIVTALVSLAANGALIPRFGIVGAAWAFLGAIGVGMSLQAFSLHRRRLQLTRRSMFALLAAVLASLVAGQFPYSPGVPALALVLFVTLCLATSVVRPQQLAQWARHVLSGPSVQQSVRDTPLEVRRSRNSMNEPPGSVREPSRTTRPHRILGVDARAANADHRAGTGTYCCELLRALAPLCGADTLRLYLDAPPREGFPIDEVHADFRILPPTWAWTQRALRSELRRDPPDVFLAPTMQVPFAVPCPVAVTVHDLAFFDFGQYFTWRTRMRSVVQARHAIRRADHIFAVSESARGELARKLGIPHERVTVTPHGVSAAFTSIQDETASFELRRTYKLPEKYILYVGRLQPRKNIERLIGAFENLLMSHPDLPHDLVIAGDKGWLCDQIFLKAQSSACSDRIHLLGFVSADHLPSLMRGADVFALVSLWEGFGIPVIEAMACGTAVVASNCSSLPEVAGNAAVLVDPYSVESIAAGLAAVLTQDQPRADLEARGRERARKFSWQTTAERTLEVLLRLADASATKSRR